MDIPRLVMIPLKVIVLPEITYPVNASVLGPGQSHQFCFFFFHLEKVSFSTYNDAKSHPHISHTGSALYPSEVSSVSCLFVGGGDARHRRLGLQPKPRSVSTTTVFLARVRSNGRWCQPITTPTLLSRKAPWTRAFLFSSNNRNTGKVITSGW